MFTGWLHKICSYWGYLRAYVPLGDTRKLIEDGALSSTSFIVFLSFCVQIMIRARGTGIDVPVWVEREVLRSAYVLMTTDFYPSSVV